MLKQDLENSTQQLKKLFISVLASAFRNFLQNSFFLRNFLAIGTSSTENGLQWQKLIKEFGITGKSDLLTWNLHRSYQIDVREGMQNTGAVFKPFFDGEGHVLPLSPVNGGPIHIFARINNQIFLTVCNFSR